MKTKSKSEIITMICLQYFLIFFLTVSCVFVQAQSPRYDKVLELSPVGYWPADESEGELLRDLSNTKNHGTIYHVPWDKQKSLLNFTGAYQWLQIPANEFYQTNSFSLGGWVYLRSDVHGSGWPNRQGMLLIGNKHWLNGVGVQLCIRQQELIDVVSDGQEDVLGSRLYSFESRRAYGEPSLELNQWHHLIYTFEPEPDKMSNLPESKNLALNAEVTASNDGGHQSRAPENAIDGNMDTQWVIWPGAGPKPDTEKWIHLEFDREIEVNRIKLISRSGKSDYFRKGRLVFSDGSSIDVPALTREWDAMFPDKLIKWVRFEALESQGPRPGLKSFEIYKEDFTVYEEEGVIINTAVSDGCFGTGKLYLNGEMIRQADNIFYKSANTDIQIGNDAYWWHQMAGKSGSLDGSVRDMVWFDRELSQDEVSSLYKFTKPQATPDSIEQEKPEKEIELSFFEALSILTDNDRSEQERASAALNLTQYKNKSDEAVPVLIDILQEIIKNEGVRIPRVEDLLRNSVIRALLDIAPEDTAAREILSAAFAKPILESVDLNQSDEFSQVRRIVQDGRYMDALDVFRKLPLVKYGERFFTYQEPGNRDYTSTARFEGAVYKVGTGRAWEGGESISKQQYKQIIEDIAVEYPTVKEWRDIEYPHLYRVPITKITEDGTKQRIYLEGEHFVLDGEDQKMLGWSVFIDEAGYVHIMGGQHNMPNPNNYIPGSWESIGISRDRSSNDFPSQMYWVSQKPGDIESLEFAGRKSDPRSIPAEYLNYLVFVQSPTNETYLYGRADAFGWQCWGMFRYLAQKQRWESVGGDVFDMLESAREYNPDWFKYLHSPVRGSIPTSPSEERPFAWAWQPPFYNFCRDNWGVRFDKTGRMHVRMQISGLNEYGYNVLSSVYAWSQDRAETFYRADGTQVKLPLTINPAPDHNADLNRNNSDRWLDLWKSLISYSGFETIK